jgi:hypothetical protein
VGGIWIFVQYIDAKSKDREQREKDFNLLLYNQRKDVYYPLCKAAGEIVASKTLSEAEPSVKVFLSLHWGAVHIPVDDDVMNAKDEFCAELLQFINRLKKEEGFPGYTLISLSNDLSKACSKALSPETIYGNKTKQ